MGETALDDGFFKALPKIELHAHLSGSINRQCLHDIWLAKKAAGQTELQDPLIEMPLGKHDYDLKTFFPLFSSYIYHLVNDAASLRRATISVLRDFAADGVVYLELRTTPRATRDLSSEGYVRAILAAIAAYEEEQDRESGEVGEEKGTTNTGGIFSSHPASSASGSPPRRRSPVLHTRLILSVDRRHSPATAADIVALASRLHDTGVGVVGVDLCGDPSVPLSPALATCLASAMALARSSSGASASADGATAAAAGTSRPRPGQQGQELGLTLHFGEAAASGSDAELQTLLGWRPGRLGHVIHVSEAVRAAIINLGDEDEDKGEGVSGPRRGQRPGLELCLSCNVRAGMVSGGFEAHHFGQWWREERVVVVLCTDDVGVFGSPLSNEYRLVAKHFGLGGQAICALARRGIEVIFGGEAERERLRRIMWKSEVEYGRHSTLSA